MNSAVFEARANPLTPICLSGIGRDARGLPWVGTELDKVGIIRDDIGSGFFIRLSNRITCRFIIYYPISLADDTHNPRIEAEVARAAANFLHMLNMNRVKGQP